MRSGCRMACVPYLAIASELVARLISSSWALTCSLSWSKAVGSPPPFWNIGVHVKKLYPHLLVSPNHQKHPFYQLCQHSSNTSWTLFNLVVCLSGDDCQPTLLGLLCMVESPLQPAMHAKAAQSSLPSLHFTNQVVE